MPKLDIASFKKHKWQFIGLGLAIVVFLLQWTVSQDFIDRFYYKGFYQTLRFFWDSTLGYSPIPLVYLLVFGLFIYLFYNIFFVSKTWTGTAIKTIGLVSWLYSIFYLMWGFNYKAPTIQSRLQLKDPFINDTILIIKLTNVIDELNSVRASLNDEITLLESTDINNEIRPSLTDILTQWKLPINGKVKVRAIRPEGILLRFSTAGIYLPFVSEGHIDQGLHKLQWPSTIAHEMSHGYGVMDEGECNFVGALACLNSDNEYVRYSGLIMYYRYLRSALRNNEEAIQIRSNKLSKEVKEDLLAITAKLNQYPDILPNARNFIYDWYLKRNGIKAGIKSYGRVIQLFISYEQKYGPTI